MCVQFYKAVPIHIFCRLKNEIAKEATAGVIETTGFFVFCFSLIPNPKGQSHSQSKRPVSFPIQKASLIPNPKGQSHSQA